MPIDSFSWHMIIRGEWKLENGVDKYMVNSNIIYADMNALLILILLLYAYSDFIWLHSDIF